MTTQQDAGLDRVQLLELRAVDGLATAQELEELALLGRDVADLARVSGRLQAALADALCIPSAEDLAAVDLTAAVMAALDVDDPWATVQVAIHNALDAGPQPELADAVLDSLGLNEPVAIRSLMARGGLVADQSPDLADDVLAALGLSPRDEVADVLGQALGVSALDSSTDFAAGVMAALALTEAASPQAAPTLLRPVAPLAPRKAGPARRQLARPASVSAGRRTTWRFPAVAVGAAAALLLSFAGAHSTTPFDQLAFELAPINHVDIEDLQSGDQVMVQVLQFDENAPTIIFIDDMSEDGAGVPL